MFIDKNHGYWSRIVETMSDGLVLVGPDGRIQVVNQALERMTGYTREEMIGQSCQMFRCDACEVIRNSESGSWCALFDEPEGKVERCRCDILCKEGTILPVLKNAAVLRGNGGEILGMVETMTDVSELRELDRKVRELSLLVDGQGRSQGMLGRTEPMRRVFSLIKKAARSQAPVIVHGESGTGKELAARSIHDLSARRNKPFIQLNCAALNESLFESELFGHVKGAFTGAYRHRSGRFEAAHGGSIFLDEIGDMPLSIQVKLLRVLETKQFERVGDHRPILVDVRIISATHRDLEAMVKAGTFRKDLYYRINVIPIQLPPLRQRREDIPLLVESIVRELARRTGKPITGLSSSALRMFMNHPWTGNVRELKSALEFGFVVAESGLIRPDHLPENLLPAPPGSGQGQPDPADPPHKKDLIQALEETGGNRSAAARILGISRGTVWNRMNRYGIKLEQIVKT